LQYAGEIIWSGGRGSHKLTLNICRHGYIPQIDSSDARKARVGAAVDVVQDLALGEQSQYGVTTGFGGSGTLEFILLY